MIASQQPDSATAAFENTTARGLNRPAARELVKYVFIGAAFGVVLVKSEIVSWYRIQEMFRFQSFHMYGILGSAMMTALVSVQILLRFNAHTLGGHRGNVGVRKCAPAFAALSAMSSSQGIAGESTEPEVG
jgi:hypothetical protein